MNESVRVYQSTCCLERHDDELSVYVHGHGRHVPFCTSRMDRQKWDMGLCGVPAGTQCAATGHSQDETDTCHSADSQGVILVFGVFGGVGVPLCLYPLNAMSAQMTLADYSWSVQRLSERNSPRRKRTIGC